MSNSELMASPHYFLQPVESKANRAAKFPVRPVALKLKATKSSSAEPNISYKMLLAVVLLHMAGFVAMLYVKPETVKLEKPQAPMMVSLVSLVETTPEEKPVPIIEPKPVVQKTIVKPKKLVEKPRVVNDDAARKVEQKEPEKIEPVDAPVVAEKTPTDAQPAENAAEVVAEVAKAKAAPEPVTEPPRFGVAYLNNPAPSYPMLARRMGEQGRVLLRVLVSENGKANTVNIDKSSGYEKLDEAAIEAVKKWTFIPAKRSSQPISAYVLVPINFSLNS